MEKSNAEDRDINQVNRTCTFEDCDRPHEAKGLCTKHYSRFRKHGSPHDVKQIKGDDITRFWSKVDKSGDCWVWQGTVHARTGYGKFSVGLVERLAHRYSYFLHNNHWPTPYCLHSCDNKLCVNPAHLREGTHRENTQDAMDRHRYVSGERAPWRKLSSENVMEIRRCIERGDVQADLARRFGVSKNMIGKIGKKVSWRHL